MGSGLEGIRIATIAPAVTGDPEHRVPARLLDQATVAMQVGGGHDTCSEQ